MSHSSVFAGVAGYVGRPGAVGVFRRPTEGDTWEHVFDRHETYAVLIQPDDPRLVFAGTANGVWRSDDAGSTFRRTEFPDAGKQIWSFLTLDDDSDRMYAGASPIGVYRSEAAQTWLTIA